MTTWPPGGGGDRTQRRPPRHNGLTAPHFVALLDVDPRLVGVLLEALRQEGIAAYAAPTPGTVGGYLDVRLPERPTDRMWVDGLRRLQARSVVTRELDALEGQPPADGAAGAAGAPDAATGPAGGTGDDAFDAIVAGFNAAPLPGPVPWPAAEDVPAVAQPPGPPPARVLRAPVAGPPPAPEPDYVDAILDEHFVPEPPPPLPRPSVVTFWAIVGIVGGLVLLVGASALGWQLDAVIEAIAAGGILVGFATLVWRMRDGDPDDDDPDDGAVV